MSHVVDNIYFQQQVKKGENNVLLNWEVELFKGFLELVCDEAE